MPRKKGPITLMDDYGLVGIQTANVLGLNRLFILVIHFQTKPTEHYLWCVAFITGALSAPWTLFALLFYIYEKTWAIIKMRHIKRCMLDFLDYWGSAVKSYFSQSNKRKENKKRIIGEKVSLGKENGRNVFFFSLCEVGDQTIVLQWH